MLTRTLLEVQWLRMPSSAGGVGSIPGWGTKLPHANEAKKKKKEKRLIIFRYSHVTCI